MPDSILTSVKHALGLDEAFGAFDQDIIMHINTALFTLAQLGVGPENAYQITDDKQEWSSFLEGRSDINAVKSYIYLKVRLLFDPPSTSFVIDAMNKQIAEFEWRLTTQTDPGGGFTDA